MRPTVVGWRRCSPGVEAVVAATRPRPGQENVVAETTTALLDAAVRILFIGGAGPLLSPAGGLTLDDPAYVPTEWRDAAAASVVQLETCRTHSADWTYLSPPAIPEPGVSTGHYRRGRSTLLTDAHGISRIFAEDLATAVLDELEIPAGKGISRSRGEVGRSAEIVRVVFGPLRERVGRTTRDFRDDGRHLRRRGGSGLPCRQDRVNTDRRHGLAELDACLFDRDPLEGDLATGGRTDVPYLLPDGQ